MTLPLSIHTDFSNKKVEFAIENLIKHIDFIEAHLGIRHLFDKTPTFLTLDELSEVVRFFRSKGVYVGITVYGRKCTELQVIW